MYINDLDELENRIEIKSIYKSSNVVDASSNIQYQELAQHAIVGFRSAGNMLATWGSEGGTPYVHLTNYAGNPITSGTNVGALTIYYI